MIRYKITRIFGLCLGLAMLVGLPLRAQATNGVWLNYDGINDGKSPLEVVVWDWSPSNVLSNGGNQAVANFANNQADGGTRPVDFDVLVQANLSGFTDRSGINITPSGLDIDYEYTVVMRFGYVVDDVGPGSADFMFDTADTTTFFEVYYDDNPNADALAGTGYNDGILVLSGTISGVDKDGILQRGGFSTDGTVWPLDQKQVPSAPWVGVSTIKGFGGNDNIHTNVIASSVNSDFIRTGVASFLFAGVSQALPFRAVDPSERFVTLPGGAPPVLFGPAAVTDPSIIGIAINGGQGPNPVTGVIEPVWGGGGPSVMFQTDFGATSLGVQATIDIEKATNGVDADDPNGGNAPRIAVGAAVNWTYVVTNLGGSKLVNVVVSDNHAGVVVSCPKDTLDPFESMICTAGGTARALSLTDPDTVPGVCAGNTGWPLYQNVGSVTAQDLVGENTSDSDPSHYCNPPGPEIDITKFTNTVDAKDPNAGDAPVIAIGDPVTWLYRVTNTGDIALRNIVVTDDQNGVVVNCPKTILAPAEVMNCSANGAALDLLNTTANTVLGNCNGETGKKLYENRGTVIGYTEGGEEVTSQDLSHYCNPTIVNVPSIHIEKATNGADADNPDAGDAPVIAIGDPVEWTYVVKNNGELALQNVAVTDSRGVAVICPKANLAVNETMICTADGTALDLLANPGLTVAGQCAGNLNRRLYENEGRVSGDTAGGQTVTSQDKSHYCNPPGPAIEIQKATNGADADNPNGVDVPPIIAGDPVAWTYVVTNRGDIALRNVVVTDSKGVTVSCPKTTLALNESMDCSANGTALDLSSAADTVTGTCVGNTGLPLYENRGTVNGQTQGGQGVTDSDPSHYCNPPDPLIAIEKATNGADADDPNAAGVPLIALGDPVDWTYVVTNKGDIALRNVVVIDSKGAAITCPKTTLAIGEAMTCSASDTALDLSSASGTVPGVCAGNAGRPLYENLATVNGETQGGQTVDATDPSHYCNPPEPAIDIEKATNNVDADDPNAGDAPVIAVDDPVAWTYVITNTGDIALQNLVVTDSKGVAVTCPKDTLAVAEDMTCSANGTAKDLENTTGTVQGNCDGTTGRPLYENLGTVNGETQGGQTVDATDPSHYCNPLPVSPDIHIEKATNNVDADDPDAGDAPVLPVGAAIAWTYVVSNIGDAPLQSVVVSDDQGVAVTCPKTTLAVMEAMTCTAGGAAQDVKTTGNTTVTGLCAGNPGKLLYENQGIATGETAGGQSVSDEDPSHYCNPPEPAIDIEKATNGVDADDPDAGDAPVIVAGDPVDWTYVVTNSGDTPLQNILVNDDQGVAVTCPKTTLAVAEAMTCNAGGAAQDLKTTSSTTVTGVCAGNAGKLLYENRGIANGETAGGQSVTDEDPSHYCNPPDPAIDIEKATNGVDADNPTAGDAPVVAIGDLVTWTYLVTNSGDAPLQNVVVTDDQGVAVTCPKTTLAVAEVMICNANGVAQDLKNTANTTVSGLCAGNPGKLLYENRGIANGETAGGQAVSDEDPSHYCNPPAQAIDVEKATNGVDADDPNAGDAPVIAIGDPVAWTYVVSNTGDTPLINVVVSDDQGVVVICPKTTLALGESMSCTADGTAEDLLVTNHTTVSGSCGDNTGVLLYENIATATGQTQGLQDATDTDPSHYCNPPATAPSIHIEKATNGADADDPNAGDAPPIMVGGAVAWTYIVTNNGDTTLTDVVVTDDQGVLVSCPKTTLVAGESMVCTANGVAEDLYNTSATTVTGMCSGISGMPLYENHGEVAAKTPAGNLLTDSDPSHYCNLVPIPPRPVPAIERWGMLLLMFGLLGVGIRRWAIGR